MNYTQELIQGNVKKLTEIIATLAYKPKWQFMITHDIPQKFCVHIECEDSTGRYDPRFQSKFHVAHHFEIPPYDMPIEELERYILDRIMDVDRHEAMEFFKIKGKAVFMPDHSDVTKLYSIHRR